MIPVFKKIVLLSFVGLIFLTPFFVMAQDQDPGTPYTLLAPISPDGEGEQKVTLTTYLPFVFNLAIGAAAALAVVMIVIGGLRYMTTEAVGGKEGGKDMIRRAIWGLVLALASWLILFTINPNLVNFSGITSGPSLNQGEVNISLQMIQGVGTIKAGRSYWVAKDQPFEIRATASNAEGEPYQNLTWQAVVSGVNRSSLEKDGSAEPNSDKSIFIMKNTPKDFCSDCKLKVTATTDTGAEGSTEIDLVVAGGELEISTRDTPIHPASYITALQIAGISDFETFDWATDSDYHFLVILPKFSNPESGINHSFDIFVTGGTPGYSISTPGLSTKYKIKEISGSGGHIRLEGAIPAPTGPPASTLPKIPVDDYPSTGIWTNEFNIIATDSAGTTVEKSATMYWVFKRFGSDEDSTLDGWYKSIEVDLLDLLYLFSDDDWWFGYGPFSSKESCENDPSNQGDVGKYFGWWVSENYNGWFGDFFNNPGGSANHFLSGKWRNLIYRGCREH